MKNAQRLVRIARRHGIRCAIGTVKEHILYNHAGIYFRKHDPYEFDSSTAEPNRIIKIPPRKLNYFQPSLFGRFVEDFDYRNHPRPVISGQWDRFRVSLTDRIFYRSLEEHFKNSVNWEHTIFIEQCLDDIAKGQSTWHNCQSSEDVYKRCREIEDLYGNMEQNGFRPVRQDDKTSAVTVNIDRHGELIQSVNGKHRTVIAKLLDIDEIPARIYIRHAAWERRRRNAELENFSEHPDLQ